MKKLSTLGFSIVALVLFLFPFSVSAKTEMTNLKEAVDEEIEIFGQAQGYENAVEELKSYDLSNYKDDKNKVNVYMFRGASCGHCFEAIVHFASIYAEEGKYFNVKTYEVWNNEDNKKLMDSVAEKLGEEAGGVPFIVIGDKSWGGYSASMDDEMMKEIKSQYNKKASARHDIIKNTNVKEENHDILYVIIIVVVAVGITCGIVFTRNNATK